MKKLLFIGLAMVLALTIGAGAAFADKDYTPKLLVTKMVELVENGLNCTISSMNNITNNGDMMVNATITDTLYCQTGGEWVTLDSQVRNGYEIAEGESVDVEFLFEEIVIPEEARVLKNEVVVKVEGSEKEFSAKWSLEFENEEAEDPEGEDPEGEPVGDTVSAVKGQAQSGKSHCYHFSYTNGPSGRLNCQIKGTTLTGVFNGKGLEDGEEYVLKLGEDILLTGIEAKNKAGNVHINFECQITEENPNDCSLSLV